MTTYKTLSRNLFVLLIAAGAASCSGGGGDSADTTTSTKINPEEAAQIAARTTKWNSYNATKTGFSKKQNAVAADVAARLIAGGLPCGKFTEASFNFIVGTYTTQGLPLPLGSGECFITGAGVDGGDENILIEVFGTSPPDASDFIAAKRKLLCKRAKNLGRLPDGTSDFGGIPYVISEDRTWIVQPDNFETNDKIAESLGGNAKDMCEGIK